MGSSPAAAGGPTDIEDIHRQAILRKQKTYIDPATGFMVFTELSHLKRGRCCGNRCRHCPYAWENVKGDEGSERAARAVSGDKEGTRRLVERIFDGTYYDEGEPSPEEATRGDDAADDDDADGLRTSAALDAPESTGGARRRSRPARFRAHGRKAAAAADSPESRNDADSRWKRSASKGSDTGGRAGGSLTSKNVPYTRGGDGGTSQLFTGERRGKDDVLFEALGTVDELCSVAGAVRAELTAPPRRGGPQNEAGADARYGDLPEQLLDVMSRLFDVGSRIAEPTSRAKRRGAQAFGPRHAARLEEWIDRMTEQLPELTSFVLPTGSPAAAQLHLARTVCRRAERRMVPLAREGGTVDPEALAYVNRLSDYFFVAARYVNYCDDVDEVQYRRDSAENDQRERVVVRLKK